MHGICIVFASWLHLVSTGLSTAVVTQCVKKVCRSALGPLQLLCWVLPTVEAVLQIYACTPDNNAAQHDAMAIGTYCGV